ncbi:hypothetical protein [Chitinophaga sp. 212800010-3]|uniref:hypothetical protein n=1 Tax=unclassified Chitinophaga TaxID=2619133 RepID=UPI002DED10F5|nr:TerB family tellurite resistance protein [Chitinophaga sp. 212800010-3]
MKMCVLFLIALCMATASYAQGVDEWLRQKATQRKYLIQQIVALQAQIAQIKKGYEIAKQGYNTIHAIKNGEFSLHTAFFTGLKTVNPKVKKYARVADIIANQVTIVQVAHQSIRQARSSPRFASGELAAVSEITDALLSEVAKTIDQLSAVVLNGKYEMSDDERLRRIDNLYLTSTQQAKTAYTLSQHVGFIDRSRLQELSENRAMRELYNLPAQ